MTTWVVVADTVRARIFAEEAPRGPLIEIEALTHPEARLHEQQLTSDLPGRSFDSAGQGRHAMGHTFEPKHQEAVRFAKEVSDRLTSARRAGRVQKLYIVAAPAFLGMLRDALDEATQRVVAGEINKNLVTHDVAEIRDHLPQVL